MGWVGLGFWRKLGLGIASAQAIQAIQAVMTVAVWHRPGTRGFEDARQEAVRWCNSSQLPFWVAAALEDKALDCVAVARRSAGEPCCGVAGACWQAAPGPMLTVLWSQGPPGTGRRLVGAVQAACRPLTLFVWPVPESVGFYNATGFTPVGGSGPLWRLKPV